MIRHYYAVVIEVNVRHVRCRLRPLIHACLLENSFTCVVLHAIAPIAHYSDQVVTRIAPIRFTERVKTAKRAN